MEKSSKNKRKSKKPESTVYMPEPVVEEKKEEGCTKDCDTCPDCGGKLTTILEYDPEFWEGKIRENFGDEAPDMEDLFMLGDAHSTLSAALVSVQANKEAVLSYLYVTATCYLMLAEQYVRSKE